MLRPVVTSIGVLLTLIGISQCGFLNVGDFVGSAGDELGKLQYDSMDKHGPGQLDRLLEQNVGRFVISLAQNFTEIKSLHKRELRQRGSVTGVRVRDEAFSKINHREFSSMSCFLWTDGKHYCIHGDSVIGFSSGKALHILSHLPVSTDEKVETYVFDGMLFLAFYSRQRATLRLYILPGPFSTTLIEVQQVVGEQLEDCVFFEHNDRLHMAVALRLGPQQFSRDSTMKCVIFEWLGTAMDVVHSIPAPGLEKISVFRNTHYAHLVLVQKSGFVQLWRLHDRVERAELLEQLDLGLPAVLQVESFAAEGRWCTLFAGESRALIYCFMGQRLFRWQVIEHSSVSTTSSWASIAVESESASSTVLVRVTNVFESYEFSTGNQFVEGFKSSLELESDCSPLVLESMTEAPSVAYVIVSCDRLPPVALEIDVRVEDVRLVPTDPLVKCFDELDAVLEEQSVVLDKVEQLRENMVRVDEDFELDGDVALTKLQLGKGKFRNVQVLPGYPAVINTTTEVEEALHTLINVTDQRERDLGDLLYSGNQSVEFRGRLHFNGGVVTSSAQMPSVALVKLNDRVWDDFVDSVWRYSKDQAIGHDLKVDSVSANRVKVGGKVGGVRPSDWLTTEGDVVIGGRALMKNLMASGNVELESEVPVNGVDLDDVVTAGMDDLRITGTKRFQKIIVENNVTVKGLINNYDLDVWFDSLLLQRSPSRQLVRGRVTLAGNVAAGRGVECSAVNGVDLEQFVGSVVMRTMDQTIAGDLEFFDANIANLRVDSLNGVATADLLTRHTSQVVESPLAITALYVDGHVDCGSLNGLDVGDFVYTDDEKSTVAGDVVFQDAVFVKDLATLPGATLNGLDWKLLVEPEVLVVASNVVVSRNLSADHLDVATVNDVDLGDLDNRFWTKSTQQTVGVPVRCECPVRVMENATSTTLNGLPMDDYFGVAKTDATAGRANEDGPEMNPEGDERPTPRIVDAEEEPEELPEKEPEPIVLKRLEVRNLKVEDTLNGARIPDDILVLNQPQTLKNYVFSFPVVVTGDVISRRGNVSVQRRVNDMKLRAFVSDAVVSGEPAAIDGVVTFVTDVKIDDLQINGFLNEVNVEELLDSGLRAFGSEHQTIDELIVNGNLTSTNAFNVTMVNGYNLGSYLSRVVDRRKPGVITGVKRASVLNVLGDLDVGEFNGVNLDFDRFLSISKEQQIVESYTLKNLQAGQVRVKKINGLALGGFVNLTSGSPWEVPGTVTFENLVLSPNVYVENINDCQVHSAERSAAPIDELSSIPSLSVLNGQLILEELADNNPRLADMINDAVRIDRPAEITGKVEIVDEETPSTFQELFVESGIVGNVNVTKVFSEAMRKSTEQVIEGPLIFASPAGTAIEKIEEAAKLKLHLWNGIEVVNLLENLVYKTGDHVVKARKNFKGDLIVNGSLEFDGLINGVSLQDFVKVSDKVFSPNTKFAALQVAGEVVVHGLVDDVDVGVLVSRAVKLDDDSVLGGDFIFQKDVYVDELKVPAINDVVMEDFVLKTAGPRQAIGGVKTFEGDVVFGDDVIVRRMNGEKMDDFFRDIVFQDEDAEFAEEASLEGDVEVTGSAQIDLYNGTDLSRALLEKVSPLREVPVKTAEVQATLATAASFTETLASSQTSVSFEYFDFTFGYPLQENETHVKNIEVRHNGALSITKTLPCGVIDECLCRHSSVFATPGDRLASHPVLERLLDSYPVKTGARYLLEEHVSERVFLVMVQQSCPEYNTNVSIVHLDGDMKVLRSEAVMIEGNVHNVKLKAAGESNVVLAIGTSDSVHVYRLAEESSSFEFVQSIPAAKNKALDLAFNGKKLYLAIAAEVSTIHGFSDDGVFEQIREVNTEGSADVVFVSTASDLYAVFTQNGLKNLWTDYSLPPKIFRYVAKRDSFYIYQELNMDRSLSLSTFTAEDFSVFLIAADNSHVQVYEHVPGQGFLQQQSFKVGGDILDVESFSTAKITHLAAATKKEVKFYRARFRGLQKP